jgi:hypothetical protein
MDVTKELDNIELAQFFGRLLMHIGNKRFKLNI